MAEAIALDVAKGIFEMVVSRVASEIQRAWAFKDELQNLEKELRELECYLFNASEASNPILQGWLKEVKNVVYHVEDMVDEYAYEMCRRELRKKKKSGSSERGSKGTSLGTTSSLDCGKIKSRLFSISNRRMSHKFKELTITISGIYIEAKGIGINPVQVAEPNGTWSRNTIALAEEMKLQAVRVGVSGKGLIGRDEDEAKITEMLLDPKNLDSDLSVVAIVGMAGLGKTAIAKRVFKKKEVVNYFEETIWVTVSHNFEVIELLKKMAEHVVEDIANMRSRRETSALIRKLEEKLGNKKYLLVLDDVWDTMKDKWEPLRSSLQDVNGSMGTTILATSRTRVAVEAMEIAGTSMTRPRIRELKGLEESDSWSLFKSVSDDRIMLSNSEPIARRLIKKCGGVPLAIKALGSLLKSQSTEEWNKIESSKLWSSEDQHRILRR